MDKWDYLEIGYRTLIFLAMVVPIGYFLNLIVESLKPYELLGSAISGFFVLGFVFYMIGVASWLTFVSKGTFRPKQKEYDCDEDMDVVDEDDGIIDVEGELKT